MMRVTPELEPRGSRPDSITPEGPVLVKAGSPLRLTYQIRLLTWMSEQDGKALTIIARPECQTSPGLERFRAEHSSALIVRRFNPRDPRSGRPTPVDRANKK